MRRVSKKELRDRAKLFGREEERILGMRLGACYEGPGGLFVAVRFKTSVSSRETHDVLQLIEPEGHLVTVVSDNGELDLPRMGVLALALAKGDMNEL